MKDLLHRLGRIEELSRPADDASVTFYHANLKALPRDYVREKHAVLIKGWPYQDGTGGECELEERPGPGPALEFGFNGHTILFTYFSYPGEVECP